MHFESSESLFAAIDAGIRRGVAAALLEHKRAGRSIFVSRDGEIVEVPPEEIEINAEDLKGNSPGALDGSV